MPASEGQADARGGNDETAAEAACSTSALLGNIPENMQRIPENKQGIPENKQFLKLLVTNILKDDDSEHPVFSFEFLPDASSAVVTFQSGKGTLHARINLFLLFFPNV